MDKWVQLSLVDSYVPLDKLQVISVMSSSRQSNAMVLTTENKDTE